MSAWFVLAVGAVVWTAAAIWLAVVIGRVIARRERQKPQGSLRRIDGDKQ